MVKKLNAYSIFSNVYCCLHTYFFHYKAKKCHSCDALCFRTLLFNMETISVPWLSATCCFRLSVSSFPGEEAIAGAVEQLCLSQM